MSKFAEICVAICGFFMSSLYVVVAGSKCIPCVVGCRFLQFWLVSASVVLGSES